MVQGTRSEPREDAHRHPRHLRGPDRVLVSLVSLNPKSLVAVICPDCSRSNNLVFYLATDKGDLIGFTKCKDCASRGDKRSLHFITKIPPYTWRSARRHGLVTVEVAK